MDDLISSHIRQILQVLREFHFPHNVSGLIFNNRPVTKHFAKTCCSTPTVSLQVRLSPAWEDVLRESIGSSLLYSCCTCACMLSPVHFWGQTASTGICAAWEEGREASLRNMTVAMVVAAQWWWVTTLRKEKSLSFSHLIHPTAMANLPSPTLASEGAATIPFLTMWKDWATAWDKGWSFFYLRWPPRAGLGPIHPLYSKSLCFLLPPAPVPLPQSCKLPSRRTCVGICATWVEGEDYWMWWEKSVQCCVCFRKRWVV